MTAFTYWYVGLVLAALAAAAVYDHRHNRKARRTLPAASSASDPRNPLRQDQREQAHLQGQGVPGGPAAHRVQQ
jgi:hypothetical protein